MCFSEGERTMALEALFTQQQQNPFGYGSIKDISNFNFSTNCGYEDFNFLQKEEQGSFNNFLENQTGNSNYPFHHDEEVHYVSNSNLSSEARNIQNNNNNSLIRHKRRRGKIRKNKEEIENQRITHIHVERNRRKQMNEYLSVLRSLMPQSYVQRGDQASIVGGAINFVKVLEQRLQFLGAQKGKMEKSNSELDYSEILPFSEFFTFPQYTIKSNNSDYDDNNNNNNNCEQCGIADIEVTMVESHANVKIRSKKRPKQLLKMVSSLNEMHLTILHLNLTTKGEIVLYSLSLKMEDDCQLGSVDEITAAVCQILNRIQQESMLNKDPNLK